MLLLYFKHWITLIKKLSFYAGLVLCGMISAIPYNRANNNVHTIPMTCSNNVTPHADFSQRFIALMEHWQLMGASIAKSENNKMLFSCGYGWADIEARRPVQPYSLFRIGSVSKTITAIAILQLIQEHKLAFDDKVFQILNKLTPLTRNKSNPGIYNITVGNLLQMSSGWYNDRPQDYDVMLGPWSNEMIKAFQYNLPPDCETAARFMMNVPLQFTPGTQFSYSNINYCLLGLIINTISGQKGPTGYEAYIKKHILSPNGINDMQLGSTEWEDKAPQEVKYYFRNYEKVFDEVDRILDGVPYGKTDLFRKNYAVGGWIASAPSLVKLLQAFEQYKILNGKIIEEMTAKPVFAKGDSGYAAMGWDEVNYLPEQRYLVKSGSITGSQALIVTGNKGISYAVLFNGKPSNHHQFIKDLEEVLLK